MVKSQQEIEEALKTYEQELRNDVYGEKWKESQLQKFPTTTEITHLGDFNTSVACKFSDFEKIYLTCKEQGISKILVSYNVFNEELSIDGQTEVPNSLEALSIKSKRLTRMCLKIHRAELEKELSEYNKYLELKEKFDGDNL